MPPPMVAYGDNMCGVVGYWRDNVNMSVQRDILVPIVRESKIRGLHAFGTTHCDGLTIVTVRYHHIDNLLSHLASARITDAIVHARYSTSGDWQDMTNNQPLCVEGYDLVFNGVIDMRTKEEMECAYGISMETGNDGELFIRHMADGGDPVEFVESCGSFAGMWYDPDGHMYALRNCHRPLWYIFVDGCTIFASTRDIIGRAIGWEFVDVAIECVPGKLYDVEELHASFW